MRSRILRCNECMRYTLKEKCRECDAPTVNTFPPRYSPQDRYGRYRRMYHTDEKED
ncbi:MAG: RNA-protein complex protein Nop10 [Thermoplasmatota archaeon]